MDIKAPITSLNTDSELDLFQVLLVLYEAHKDDLQALEDILAFTDRLANDGSTYYATAYIYGTVGVLKKKPGAKDPEYYRKKIYDQLTEYMPDEDIHAITDVYQNDFASTIDIMILPHLDDSEVAALNGLSSILHMLAEQVPHTTESVKALTAKVHDRLAKLKAN